MSLFGIYIYSFHISKGVGYIVEIWCETILAKFEKFSRLLEERSHFYTLCLQVSLKYNIKVNSGLNFKEFNHQKIFLGYFYSDVVVEIAHHSIKKFEILGFWHFDILG